MDKTTCLQFNFGKKLCLKEYEQLLLLMGKIGLFC